MIKKLIKRLLGKGGAAPAAATAGAKPALGKRLEIAAADHGIDARLLDERAVKVVATLKEAGHEAYIVGGAVRDLLVGRRPKDFDVATDATPEQVKALFRRAFIIGRRFRIVHVIFGRGRDHEVVEVSTFRAYVDNAAAEAVAGNEKTSKSELAGRSHAVDTEGRVLRDNVWGPQVEDAARRDFSINAMYYDPITQTVVDYHQGLADVRKGVLRMIGDASARYREDPVRILRVVRFAAKLGFEIEPKTRAPIRELAPLLDNVPASRLFDEMVKLLQTGRAQASVDTLGKMQLGAVFPILRVLLGPKADEPRHAARRRFVELALADTDRRVREGRAVVPSFLLACLLWHEVQERWNAGTARGEPSFPALAAAIDTVFDARIGDISGRGKLAADMRELWAMQPRFERRVGNSARALIEQPRFRAGYDFLRLRADAGEADTALAEWWEDFSLGSDEERDAMLAAVREQQRPQRVRRVAAAKPAADAPAAAAATAASGSTAPRAPRKAAPGAAAADALPAEAPRRAAAAEGAAEEPQRNEPADAADGADDAEAAAPAARRRRRRRRRPAADASADASTADAVVPHDDSAA